MNDQAAANDLVRTWFQTEQLGLKFEISHAIGVCDQAGQVTCVMTTGPMFAVTLRIWVEMPARAHAVAT